MSELVADCPRCGAKRVTFDLNAYTSVGVRYRWQHEYEAFCVCRHCEHSTVFILRDRGLDSSKYIKSHGLVGVDVATGLVDIEGYVSRKDNAATPAPEHLPYDIKAAFDEGATCLAVGCYNAAGTMFRLAIDLATRALLPQGEESNAKVRRSLGLRLSWLFERGVLPDALRDLSDCIKEDGNDGAHAGTLTRADAEDLLDFTEALLERLYTEPERLRLAKERREVRRRKA